MSTMERRPDVEVARRLRSRRAVDRVDYLRVLRRLSTSMTQTDLAQSLGMTQPSISSALKSAATVSEPREGFSGASAYEIAQRYAAGEIDRDQLVDELTRWEYVPRPQTDGYDDLLIVPDGTFEEVGRALDQGLIDGQTYDVILHASAARRRAAG